MIGLEAGMVRLAPFSDEWKVHFMAEKAALQAVVGAYIRDIQHVGSTSIPGMPAKPIIDIAIAILDFNEGRVCIEPIVALGYEYKGENGIPRRHYFAKGEPRTFHIHMFEAGSLEWQNHLLFRDYLIKHRDVAEEYARLKLQLASSFPQDRQAYTDGKMPFIQGILHRARAEVSGFGLS